MNLIQIITELKKVNFEVEVLKSIFADIDNNNPDNNIKIGSRVLIKWGDGRQTKGRVTGIKKDGSFYVNRDGYSGVIALGINKPGLLEHSLENLSVDIYGKLDERLYYSQKRIVDLEDSIKKTIGVNYEQFQKLKNKLEPEE